MTAASARASLRSRLMSLAGVVLITVSLVTIPAVQSDAATDELVVSELEFPFQTDRAFIGAIDQKARRMYVFVNDPTAQLFRIAVYDLKPSVPKLVKVSEPGVTRAALFSPYRVILDRARDRMLVINLRDEGQRSKIDVIDLSSLTLKETWDLAKTAPGFLATGFTLDAKADRVYMVGDFTASKNAGGLVNTVPGTKPFSQGSAVVALNAATGSLAWVNPMSQCDTPLDGAITGALIAQSTSRPALYMFCVGGNAAYQSTGQNGLYRMDISGQAKAAGLQQFPSEFFPISGTYTGFNRSGLAAFDPVTERFFAQSLSTRTPGTWVFDGLRNSWVGFITAPDSNNEYYGLNTKNGRYYMGGRGETPGPTGYVNVADGRSTPVAQGTLFGQLPIFGQILADSDTDRLFAPLMVPDEKGFFGFRHGVLMIRDRTQSITPLPDIALDKLTKDLPDNKALMQYSAAASGFGARYSTIGGWESVYDRLTVPFLNTPLGTYTGSNPGQLAYGDRGVMYSAVPAVDIRPSGASGTATAGALDQATASDRKDAENKSGQQAAVPLAFLDGGVTCLDGAGKRIEKKEGTGDPGRAHVDCDLAAGRASAVASYADDLNGGGQSLGASAFSTRTFRDPKRGVVTETTTVARGISLREPGGKGTVSIKRVSATALTIANGRPGTSSASWTRTVEGVVMTDADGKPSQPQSCTTTMTTGKDRGDSGDCEGLERQINQFTSRTQVRFPTPVMTATPRGAFARVEEQEKDYYNGLTTNNDQSRAVPAAEFTIFNDGPEKGRLLVQLAAIDANSIFTRSGLFEAPNLGTTTTVRGTPSGGTRGAGGTDGGTTDEGTGTAGATGSGASGGGGSLGVGGESGTLGAGGVSGGDDLAPSVALGADSALGGTGTGAVGSPPVMGWLIGARGPREAALAIGVWLLFAGALSSVWRRRRLIETVGN